MDTFLHDSKGVATGHTEHMSHGQALGSRNPVNEREEKLYEQGRSRSLCIMEKSAETAEQGSWKLMNSIPTAVATP